MKKKFFAITALIALLAVLCLCSCSGENEAEEEINPSEYDYDMLDLSFVADEVYAALDISELTAESVEVITDELVLSEQFYLDLSNIISHEVRSADGKYGLADVVILHVKEGKANDVMDSLEMRKDDRINEFLNYDVYDSYDIALEGEIYQAGELVVMLLLSEDDKAAAKGIIDYYIP